MNAYAQVPREAPAILHDAFGGPDVLRLADVPVPQPGPGEVLLRHTAIGVNFSDVNARRGGFYREAVNSFPMIPGNEAVGQVVEASDGAGRWKPGDRIAYAGMGGPFFADSGAYATYRAVPQDRLVRVPAALGDVEAAAVLMKGLTASAAIRRFHAPAPGEAVLVHAAASGVGLVLCQWAKHLGARVLGTVGNAEKARVARDHGCDEAIPYRETDFVAAVRALCPDGVAAVYDGVGKDTFLPSLDVLRPFGKLVNYGNASGAAPSLDVMLLSSKGSLSVGRVALGDHIRRAEDYQAAAEELLELCRRGVIRPHLRGVMPLAQAAEAHRQMESGQGAGALVLVP